MAILITGSEGFVGSHLTSALKNAGREAACFKGDVADRQEVLDFEPGQQIDMVVHLAAVLSGRDEKLFKKVNVEGTANILALAKKLGVKKFIFLSSSRALSADSDPYINSKKEAGKLVKASGLDYLIIRPTMLYGPGDNKNIGLLIKLIKKFRLAPIFDFKLQPVFVDDLVELIMANLKLLGNREINVSGPVISFEQLIMEIKKLYPGFLVLNWPRLFNALIKSFSCLSFSPFPRWQVKTLLVSEIFGGEDWASKFNMRETPLREGLSKIL